MKGFSDAVLREKARLERVWRAKAEVVRKARRGANSWEKRFAADILANWKGELMQKQKVCLDKAYEKCRI
ncbi:MAG: hypothetical protein ACLP4V_25500 [Methylocella sp.]